MILTIISIVMLGFSLMGMVTCILAIISAVDSCIQHRIHIKQRRKNIKRVKLYCDTHPMGFKAEEQAIEMIMSGYPMDKVYRHLYYVNKKMGNIIPVVREKDEK